MTRLSGRLLLPNGVFLCDVSFTLVVDDQVQFGALYDLDSVRLGDERQFLLEIPGGMRLGIFITDVAKGSFRVTKKGKQDGPMHLP